jgi:hypothetical protein
MLTENQWLELVSFGPLIGWPNQRRKETRSQGLIWFDRWKFLSCSRKKPVVKRSVFWSIDWLTGREERSKARERVKRGFVWRKSALVPEQEEILLPGRVYLNEYQICGRSEKLLIAVFAIRLRKKSQFWIWFLEKERRFFCFSQIVEKKSAEVVDRRRSV